MAVVTDGRASAAGSLVGTLVRTREADIRVPDPDATVRFLCEVLEFVDLGRRDGHHDVGLAQQYGTPGPTRVFTIGQGTGTLLQGVTYELAPGSRHALQAHLERLGANVEPAPDGDVHGDGLVVQDLNGITIICREPATPSPVEPAPSVLRPRRFGHVTMKVPDGRATADWYIDHLGFRMSELVEGRMHFLRLGAEHHRLAIGGGGTVADAQHFAFEVPGWDYYRLLLDHLAARGHGVEFGPGRHAPGDNLFVYLRDPSSRLRLELYADMAMIDDDATYQVKTWQPEDMPRTVNQWGPGPPPSFREE